MKPLLPETAAGPAAAQLRRLGAIADPGAHLPDDPAVLESALTGDADLVVIIGATGRGVADHLRAAIARAGGFIVVDGVAMRPGGSVLLATLPGARTRVLLGVGGNPLAAVAGVALLGPPVIDALTSTEAAAVELISCAACPEPIGGEWFPSNPTAPARGWRRNTPRHRISRRWSAGAAWP